jgi:hypothetical protein
MAIHPRLLVGVVIYNIAVNALCDGDGIIDDTNFTITSLNGQIV